jgi:mannose-1-phosphate guanylyltransferase
MGPTSPWVVVLAGGDGRRLEGARVHGRSLDRPKQFCRLSGRETLLECTLRRAARLTPPERVVVMVRDDHLHWWRHEQRRHPDVRFLTESANRGTAVAILDALANVLLDDPDPMLVVLPSDHSVDDEGVLAESIELACRWAASHRDEWLVLGMTPDSVETEYGWILPDPDGADPVQDVSLFVEKPPPEIAAEMFEAGALWNTFIVVGSGDVLLGLFERGAPQLLGRYLECFGAQATEDRAANTLFPSLPHTDFSRDIMEAATARLRVLPVPECGWIDLGTPHRVDRWLERRGSRRRERVATP